jgi:hypothetical protein
VKGLSCHVKNSIYQCLRLLIFFMISQKKNISVVISLLADHVVTILQSLLISKVLMPETEESFILSLYSNTCLTRMSVLLTVGAIYLLKRCEAVFHQTRNVIVQLRANNLDR